MSTTGALVRFSYLNCFEPKAQKLPDGSEGEPKYSVCCLIPKSDVKSLDIIRAEVERTIKKGLADKKFNEAQAKSAKFKRFLRDGDEYYAENPKPENETFKGHMFFNVSSKNKPGIVDEHAQPIITNDTDKMYSGAWGRVDAGLYPFNFSGNIGIGGALNNLMFVKHGERLDGRQKAEDAFASFAATEDNSDLQ